MNIQIEKIPKHAQKHVYWESDGQTGTAFIIVGYCPNTLPYFLGLYEEAIKDFPNLQMADIRCGKLSESRWHKKFYSNFIYCQRWFTPD